MGIDELVKRIVTEVPEYEHLIFIRAEITFDSLGYPLIDLYYVPKKTIEFIQFDMSEGWPKE